MTLPETMTQLMRSIESASNLPSKAHLPSATPGEQWAAYAGVASKFLAIGAPERLGIVDCGASSVAIVACHQLLFGDMELRWAGNCEGLPKDKEMSVEETMASDIVCLYTSADIRMEWIAEATHLNLWSDSAAWSAGTKSLKGAVYWTLAGGKQSALALPKTHGSLTDVIVGKIAGRKGEEITALLYLASEEP